MTSTFENYDVNSIISKLNDANELFVNIYPGKVPIVNQSIQFMVAQISLNTIPPKSLVNYHRLH